MGRARRGVISGMQAVEAAAQDIIELVGEIRGAGLVIEVGEIAGFNIPATNIRLRLPTAEELEEEDE